MKVFERDDGYGVELHPREKIFKSALYFIKRIPGRVWDDRNKYWIIPFTHYSSATDLAEKLAAQIKSREVVEQKRTAPLEALPELTIDIPLKKQMYAFQKKGVAYMLKHEQVISGDQQGLGKTIQAIAAVIAKDEWPGLVICKNSLRLNWRDEFEAWTDKRPLILTDSMKYSWPNQFDCGFYDLAICNYESLHKYFVRSIRIPKGETFRLHHVIFYDWINLFKWVIVDESHYVKDMTTKRTKFTAGITQGKSQVYLLSGTPALNHPMEIYTQICILNKQKHFGDFQTFKRTFCGNKNKRNLPALNKLLNEHCYYRRIKSDPEVALDLPEKTRQVILCDITNRPEYEKAEKDFEKFLRENTELSSGQINARLRAEALTQMMELKKLAAYGKIAAVKEWVESLIEQDEKMVLFCYHKEIQQQCADMVPGAVLMGSFGDVNQRQANKEKFQTDPDCKLIVCSLSADSEGHTLTAASNLGMVELPWHFGKAEQCEDRIHRIGTRYPVTCTYFLADKTIDRKIYKLIMDKKEMHDQITGTDEKIEMRTIDRLINLFYTP